MKAPFLQAKYLLIVLGPLCLACSSLIKSTDKISDGERLYRSKCSACHMLIERERLSKEGWKAAVEKYGAKLTEEDRSKILQHLTQ
ncbi:MAG TPA: cytochrome c [bacterium]